ncbi:serine hydrolase domain-containing protein [Micromonospora zhanjiangensis]
MPSVEKLLIRAVEATDRPPFSAAVALIHRDGRPVESAAVGELARWADTTGTPAPAADRRPVTPDTLFDLASVTKLFTTTVLLGLADEGTVDLDEPVARRLPEFDTPERREVTTRRLLTHTSGLPALLRLWTDHPDRSARIAAILNAPWSARPAPPSSTPASGSSSPGCSPNGSPGSPCRTW